MFSTGEKIWITSVILYIIGVLIGNQMGISVIQLSIFGSIGMVLFLIICITTYLISWTKPVRKLRFKIKNFIKL